MRRVSPLRFAPPRALVGLGALALGIVAGCDRGRDPSAARNTGAAVASAFRRVSDSLGEATAAPSAAVDEAAATRALPALHVSGVGTGAHVTADREDDQHRGLQSVPTPGGFGLAWGDAAHRRAVFARIDREGHAVGASIVVHEAQSDEEEVWAPSVAFNGDEYAVTWTDPANGRVEFAHYDSEGRQVGRGTTIHMGLTMPMGTRILWTGSDYAVAVAVAEGVYFARVDRQGARIGDGLMVAEGARVADLAGFTLTPQGFQIAWREEQGAERTARVSRDGRRVEPLGQQHAPRLAGSRFALR